MSKEEPKGMKFTVRSGGQQPQDGVEKAAEDKESTPKGEGLKDANKSAKSGSRRKN